jgi:hypothetical protein
MDLWTDRLQANRALLPWITTKSLPTAPPSDHKSTDPQTQGLSYMGSKAKTHSGTFELIAVHNLLCLDLSQRYESATLTS